MRLTWRVKRLEKRALAEADPGPRPQCRACGGVGALVILIEGVRSSGAPCASCGAAVAIDYVVGAEEPEPAAAPA